MVRADRVGCGTYDWTTPSSMTGLTGRATLAATI
jgi:hypothetical protein